MSESDEEIDDPGRDPKGLDPPRNVLLSSPQDTGQHGHANVGPADKPEPPTEEPESEADEADDSDGPDKADESDDA